MKKNYTMVEHLAQIVKERKAAGKTNGAIAENYGLTFKQIKDLTNLQNRWDQLLVAGYILLPKVWPRERE